MKRYLALILFTITLVSCTKSPSFESAIESIYGVKIKPTNEHDGLTYTLDYSNKALDENSDEIKLKDKIDKITQSIGEHVGDLPSKEEHGYGVFYKWETPDIRVIMVVNKSTIDKDRSIIIVINKK